jgi:hypothetical protein
MPMTLVSIKLNIGCKSHIPRVGNPNLMRSLIVGTACSFVVVIVASAADVATIVEVR